MNTQDLNSILISWKTTLKLLKEIGEITNLKINKDVYESINLQYIEIITKSISINSDKELIEKPPIKIFHIPNIDIPSHKCRCTTKNCGAYGCTYQVNFTNIKKV